MPKIVSFGNSTNNNVGLMPNFTSAPASAQGIVAVHVPGVEGPAFNTACQYVFGRLGRVGSAYIPRLTTAPPTTATHPGTSITNLIGRCYDSTNLNAVRALMDTNYCVMQYLPSGHGCVLYFLYTPTVSYIPRYQVIDSVSVPIQQNVSLAMWVGSGCEYLLLSPLVYAVGNCSSPIAAPNGQEAGT